MAPGPRREAQASNESAGAAMAERSLGRTLGSLVLALLNATLLLAVLCLWLAWGALSAAERASGQILQAAETVLPLRDDIAGLRAELAATRAEIAALGAGAAADGAGPAGLEAHLGRLEAGVAGLTEAVGALAPENPEALIEQAVAAAFAGFGGGLAAGLAALRRDRAPAGAP